MGHQREGRKDHAHEEDQNGENLANKVHEKTRASIGFKAIANLLGTGKAISVGFRRNVLISLREMKGISRSEMSTLIDSPVLG
jgi:hypothetical protein